MGVRVRLLTRAANTLQALAAAQSTLRSYTVLHSLMIFGT